MKGAHFTCSWDLWQNSIGEGKLEQVMLTYWMEKQFLIKVHDLMLSERYFLGH